MDLWGRLLCRMGWHKFTSEYQANMTLFGGEAWRVKHCVRSGCKAANAAKRWS